MRKLVGIAVLAAVVLSGVWLGWAYMLERGFTSWLEARRSEGWVAEATRIDTTGYPLRFDTVATNLDLADPATGLAWRLPQIAFRAVAHDPTDIEVVVPPAFTVASPGERITVRSATFRASTAVDPGPSLRLRRADITLAGINLRSNAGWEAALTNGSLRTERAGDDETLQRITFTATEVRPSQPLRAVLDPAGVLPDTITELAVDADLGFDRPWDRRAIEDRFKRVLLDGEPLDEALAAINRDWNAILAAAPPATMSAVPTPAPITTQTAPQTTPEPATP